MGAKSRGNWQLGYCMKSDCVNRDKKCDECFRFSAYEKKENQESKKQAEKDLAYHTAKLNVAKVKAKEEKEPK